MNDEDELVREKSSLTRKIKHLAESQLIGRQILEKTIDEIYQTLLKLPGYKSRYTRIALNNETFGAISLAKINIQSIANTLIGYTTKEKSKSPPPPPPLANNKRSKVRRAYNVLMKTGGPSNYISKIAKNLGYSSIYVRKILSAPTRSKVNKFNIEWFIDGNRKKIRVESNDDMNINELATKANLNNMVSRFTNRSLKKVTINFKKPLSNNKNMKVAVKNATKKIRNIMAKKIPSGVPMYI